MCGIFAILNSELSSVKAIRDAQYLESQSALGKGRGPEHSSFQKMGVQCFFGFHRLAINGLNEEANQPLTKNNISLICNGEIYNYIELYQSMGVEPITESDCEVILHLYERYGIEHTLQMLDGVFAFVLIDNRITENNDSPGKVYVARDPYGVRPLYTLTRPSETSETNQTNEFTQTYCFASEVKMLSDIAKQDRANVHHFEPGTFAEYILPQRAIASWTHVRTRSYHSTGFNSNMLLSPRSLDEFPSVLQNIQCYLMAAVFKRCCAAERPIACLLSGGLDSSLITALVSEYHKAYCLPPVETYSIGLAGSEDLKYAKMVAEHLGTNHTEIVLTETDFVAAVPDVIRAIESYDTTTVRASIGNWLLGRYIAQNSQAKVIFNGDGSDELAGGYLYMHRAPDAIEFDKECRRLLKDIHQFDVLRSDKSISSHGLEPRTPFLDRSWVQYYLSVLLELRYHPGQEQMEKWLIREAFSLEHFKNSSGLSLLPPDILWRRKEAFSDGVTGQTRSLYEILGDHAESMGSPNTINYLHNPPQTAEQRWYRAIFEEAYPGMANLVPYFWMPKYVEAKDASARTLSIY